MHSGGIELGLESNRFGNLSIPILLWLDISSWILVGVMFDFDLNFGVIDLN